MLWSQVNQTLSYFLDDDPKEGEPKYSYPVPLRATAWNWAQRVFSAHTAMQKKETLVLEADRKSAVLPAGLLQVKLVYEDGSLKTYVPLNLVQGGRHDSFLASCYWLWAGSIYFGQPIASDKSVAMQYTALWPDVEYALQDGTCTITQPNIYVPDWAEPALCHLTAASVLQPSSIAAAIARNYNTRIDSGTPDDNARRSQAWEHWKWYQALISTFPTQA